MRTPVLPDHSLLRPIGRGAYGEVWLARNVMGTLRAVKVIWREQFESARPFEREFAGIQRYEPVSRSSGGLVHVLHVGRSDAEGYFYYVMELADEAEEDPKSEIRNPKEVRSPKPETEPVASEPSDFGFRISDFYRPRTLRSDLKRLGRLPTSDCLRLAIDVASGLGQLHRRGLVHRDVKPGNIIYVNGRAKLADIGLVTTEGEGRTFVGTEGYIPPEGPGTTAADLYALGVVLYEASTGFPPERLPDVPAEWFTGPAGDEALELHEVILKACEGQRERRYANADAMQADLALLQSGQSVRHTRALQRRYARLRLSGIIGTTLLVFALMAALFANYRARLALETRANEARLRHRAQQAQAEAENAEREARRQLQAARYEQARALVLSKELGHRVRALEAIRQAVGSTNAAEMRRVAFAALGLPDLRLERELTLPPGQTLSLLDPKIERIALCREQEPVTIRALPDLRILATLPATSPKDTFGGCWSADGRFLAVKREYDDAGRHADLEVWNVGRTQLLFTARQDIAYNAFGFHPRRPLLIAGHIGGAVSVWDVESTKEVQAFHLPATPVALACSPEGERFATSYYSGSNWVVAFHDAVTGRLLAATQSPEPAVLIVWHPNGRWVSVLGGDATESGREVRIIEADGGQTTLLGRHKIKTAGLAFSPDGRYLMSCGWERELFCWDLQTRQRAFTFPDAGYTLTWSADGRHCATIPKGERLQLFAFEQPAGLELSGNRGERLRPGAFSPDGCYLAIPDSQNLCVWECTRSSEPALLDREEFPALPFFAADSLELFEVGGRMGEAHLSGWRISPDANRHGAPEFTPLSVGLPPLMNWASLAGDDLVLTSAEGVRFVARTNLATAEGRIIKISSGQGTVSPDGRWLAATYSFSPWITVYRLPAVEEVARLETSHFVAGVWFSPASEELTVINRGGIEQWDTATWHRKNRQPGVPVSYSYVLYTPDHTGVWRVTNFRDTALYERNTLEPVLPLPANVLPLAVSADGCRLAVSVDDQRVQVWNLPELQGHLRELGLDWEGRHP